MKLTTLLALVAPVLASPAAPFNTPAPMLPGAYANCEGFFLASPGVTCASIAASHALSFEEFIRINPQIQAAGGCEAGGIRPHHWYCIKPWAGSPPPPTTTQSTTRPARIANGPLRPTSTRSSTTTSPSMVRTFTTRLVDAPKSTPPPEKCKVDDCFRGFLRIVPAVAHVHRRFCSDLLEKPCTATSMEQLNAPAVIANECPQTKPCAAVTSACACYLDGEMDRRASP